MSDSETSSEDLNFKFIEEGANKNKIQSSSTDMYHNLIANPAKEKEVVEECKEVLECFDNPVALHIRRGDYLINSANHHNLSLKYYEEALKYFPVYQENI